MATSKRVIYDVTFDAAKKDWRVTTPDSTRAVARAGTKVAAVEQAVVKAKNTPMAQVRIHTKNGRIESERTYPRSSDPRRTPG
jgi:hypothetical protein